ncbi:MAG: ATP phosphoribosyltransferase regulatory subunit [Clostridiaceae bacterium]
MNKFKRYLPEGVTDILFEDCRRKTNIEMKLRKFYKKSGYHELISPTFEFYDVFQGRFNSYSQETMFKFFDNLGRILVLRPDMTTPIARIAGTKLENFKLPLKLCYNGNIYKTNESWNGKISEITQSGIEVIGVGSKKSDIEVLITAINALIAIDIKDFEIEIGEVNFLIGILEDTKLDEDKKVELKLNIENKNFAAIKNFARDNIDCIGEDISYLLKEIPKMYGGLEILDKARSMIKNKKSLKALDDIEDIYKVIEDIGLASYISIDLGMIQEINYYTGIIFKGYTKEVGSEILSGGRYDNLVSDFGRDLKAIGFGINVDSIVQALDKKQGKYLDEIIRVVILDKGYYKEAYKLSGKIKDIGLISEISLFDEENHNENADYLIEFEKNDLCKLTDLKRNEYKIINIEDIIIDLEDIYEAYKNSIN